MFVGRSSLLILSLALVSCERAAIEPSQSLVGAESLPSPSALSREIIQINRGYGQVSEGFLSYELQPDDSLVVTDEDRAANKVRGKETFHLSFEAAGHARRMLWRLRPAILKGIEEETRPYGCERQGPDDFGQVAVVFINEGKKDGIQDDQVGVVELPYPESCDTRQAKQARALMEQVLRSFPASKVAAAFPKSE